MNRCISTKSQIILSGKVVRFSLSSNVAQVPCKIKNVLSALFMSAAHYSAVIKASLSTSEMASGYYQIISRVRASFYRNGSDFTFGNNAVAIRIFNYITTIDFDSVCSDISVDCSIISGVGLFADKIKDQRYQPNQYQNFHKPSPSNVVFGSWYNSSAIMSSLILRLDIFSKSEHRDSVAAKSANGIATPELSQALEPRQLLNAVFLWSGVKVNLRVIRSCERGCKYWNVRSPRIATSCDRLSIITGGPCYG